MLVENVCVGTPVRVDVLLLEPVGVTICVPELVWLAVNEGELVNDEDVVGAIENVCDWLPDDETLCVETLLRVRVPDELGDAR